MRRRAAPGPHPRRQGPRHLHARLTRCLQHEGHEGDGGQGDLLFLLRFLRVYSASSVLKVFAQGGAEAGEGFGFELLGALHRDAQAAADLAQRQPLLQVAPLDHPPLARGEARAQRVTQPRGQLLRLHPLLHRHRLVGDQIAQQRRIALRARLQRRLARRLVERGWPRLRHAAHPRQLTRRDVRQRRQLRIRGRVTVGSRVPRQRQMHSRRGH